MPWILNKYYEVGGGDDVVPMNPFIVQGAPYVPDPGVDAETFIGQTVPFLNAAGVFGGTDPTTQAGGMTGSDPTTWDTTTTSTGVDLWNPTYGSPGDAISPVTDPTVVNSSTWDPNVPPVAPDPVDPAHGSLNPTINPTIYPGGQGGLFGSGIDIGIPGVIGIGGVVGGILSGVGGGGGSTGPTQPPPDGAQDPVVTPPPPPPPDDNAPLNFPVVTGDPVGPVAPPPSPPETPGNPVVLPPPVPVEQGDSTTAPPPTTVTTTSDPGQPAGDQPGQPVTVTPPLGGSPNEGGDPTIVPPPVPLPTATPGGESPSPVIVPPVPLPGGGGGTPVVPPPPSSTTTVPPVIPPTTMPTAHRYEPHLRDYATEGRRSIEALQGLQPDISGLYGSATKAYSQADLDALNSILGQYGQTAEGLTGLANQQTAASNTALRSGNIADVQALAGTAQGIQQQANPQLYAGMDEYTQAAMSAMQRDNAAVANAGQLTPEEVRNAQQSAREGWAARGLVNSTGSVAAEVLNREAYRQQREATARANAQQSMGNVSNALGIQTANRFDPFATILGQQYGMQTANVGTNQALYGQTAGISSGAQGNQFVQNAFNPYNVYSNDVEGTNVNAKNAAEMSYANNAAALQGANTAANQQLLAQLIKSSPDIWNILGPMLGFGS